MQDPLQSQASKELNKAIVEELSFKDFVKTPIWESIRIRLKDEIESFKEQLVREKDLEQIKKVQAVIAALRFIPKHIEDILTRGEEARMTLEAITQYNETLI
jgi:hypothetical protein